MSLSDPADGSLTHDSTPQFGGGAGTAAGDAATVHVRVYAGAGVSGDPVVVLSASVDGGGGWSVDAADALPDGTYTAQAEQSDAADNVGRSAAHTFTLAAAP